MLERMYDFPRHYKNVNANNSVIYNIDNNVNNSVTNNAYKIQAKIEDNRTMCKRASTYKLPKQSVMLTCLSQMDFTIGATTIDSLCLVMHETKFCRIQPCEFIRDK